MMATAGLPRVLMSPPWLDGTLLSSAGLKPMENSHSGSPMSNLTQRGRETGEEVTRAIERGVCTLPGLEHQLTISEAGDRAFK